MGSNSIDQLHKEKKNQTMRLGELLISRTLVWPQCESFCMRLRDISTIILFSATYPQFPLAVTS